MNAVLTITLLLGLSSCHCLALANFIKRPVRIHATKTVVQPVECPPCGTNSLHQYMQLPAAQYTCVPMPLNSSLTRVKGSADLFHLEVPKMHFKIPGVSAVEVLPSVNASVTVEEERVVIASDCCTIRGSPVIEKLQLNDYFEFRCRACLTWDEEKDDELQKGDKDDTVNSIQAHTEIEVDFYPPGVFARIPRKIQEPIGNLAMFLALKTLLTKFMRGLGGDYVKWSTDGDYRTERQQMEDNIQRELEEYERQRQRAENANKKRNRILFR